MAYSNYQLEDFIADEYFIKWVKAPNEESNAYWNAWISNHQYQKATIQQAREIILRLEFKENHAPEGKFLEIWEKIAPASEEESVELSLNRTPSKNNSSTGSHWYLKIAASVALICLSLWVYNFYENSKPIIIATAYGESQTLFLPDSTKVTLNANSKISYKEEDFNENHREVQLEGQAFFSVVHKADNQNFKVHTQELQVEVLGTRFDVNSRRGTTKVILEEGKVRLDMERKNQKNQTVMMRPGDLVEVSGNAKKISRKTVDPQGYLSWRNNTLEFNATPLSEIGQLIEDNYGYKVVFADEELRERKFTGTSSSDDIHDLLKKLSKLFDMSVSQKGMEIIIEKQ